MWVYRSVGKKSGLEGHQRVTTYSVSCSSNGWIASQPSIAAVPKMWWFHVPTAQVSTIQQSFNITNLIHSWLPWLQQFPVRLCSKWVGIVEERHARTCRHIHDHSCHTARNEVENEPHLKQSSPVSPSTAMPRLRPRSPIFTWKLRKFLVLVAYLCKRTGCSRYCHLFSLYSPCYHGAYPLWLFDAPEILELPRQGGALPCSWKRLLRLQSDKNVRRFQVLQWGCGLEIKCMKSCLWQGWMKTIQAVNTHK